MKTLLKDFSTSELGLATAIVCLGYELREIKRIAPSSNKVVFIFVAPEEVEQIVQNYWSNKLAVDARSMFENLKMLKSRIYS